MIPLWYACAEFNKNVTDFLLREPHSTTSLIQDKVVFSLSYFSVGDLDLSPCFLNKIIGMLENHSQSLSFSLSLQEKRGIEKKGEIQNDSLECQYNYSKSPSSGSKGNFSKIHA